METDCDQKLIVAYYKTSYKVPELNFTIKLGQKNPGLQRWCAEKKIQSWAFITAWNPMSERYSKSENDLFNEKLKKQLDEWNYLYWEGLGVPEDGEDWEAEESFFVVNIELKEALSLGKLFKQCALVFSMEGMRPSMMWI